jgi:hypothetical protein
MRVWPSLSRYRIFFCFFLVFHGGIQARDIVWDWDTDWEFEGWVPKENIQVFTAGGGLVTLSFADPGDAIFRPSLFIDSLSFDADSLRYVRIEQRVTGYPGCEDIAMGCWGRPGTPDPGETYVFKDGVFYPGAGWSTIILDMHTGTDGNAWSGLNAIQEFQLDPCRGALYENWASAMIEYDRVMISADPSDPGPWEWPMDGAGPGSWLAAQHAPYAGSNLTISGGTAVLSPAASGDRVAMMNCNIAVDAAACPWLVLDLEPAGRIARDDFPITVSWRQDGAHFGISGRRRKYLVPMNAGMRRHVFDLSEVTGQESGYTGAWDGYVHGLLIEAGNGSSDLFHVSFDTVELRDCAPPSIGFIPDGNNILDKTAYSMTPSLLTGAPVSWSLLAPDPAPDTFAFDSATGAVSWTADAVASPLAITVLAQNACGSAEETWSLHVISDAPPGVSLVTSASAQINGPLTIDALFTEPVTALDAGDIDVVNAAVSDITGADAYWSFTLTPAEEGLVSVRVLAGAVEDGMGQTNPDPSNMLSFNYDATPPEVVLNCPEEYYTNASSITVTAVFTEAVDVFTEADIALTNGVVTELSGGAANWTFTVAPSGDGLVAAVIPADAVVDLAGNGNLSSDSFSVIYDSTAPVVDALSVSGARSAEIVFDESNPMGPSVLEPGLYTVSGSGAGTLNPHPDRVYIADQDTWRLSWDEGEMRQGGDITVTVSDGVTDRAGNPAGEPDHATDSGGGIGVSPQVSIYTTVTQPAKIAPVPVYFSFDEAILPIEAEDITVQNAAIDTFTTLSADRYRADLIPDNDGPLTLTVSLAAGVTVDLAGNPNPAGGPLNILFDATRPVAVFTVPDESTPGHVNVSPFTVLLTFSEAVSGFDPALESGDLDIAGGYLVDITPGGDGASDAFTLHIGAHGQGTIVLSLPEGAAEAVQDRAPNYAAEMQIYHDGTPPEISLETEVPEYTPLNPIGPFELHFSEAADGFDGGDLMINNGMLTQFTDAGNNRDYTFFLAPAVSQPLLEISFEIAAETVTDAAGNTNTDAFSHSFFHDAVPPVIDEVRVLDAGRVRLDFSEEIIGGALLSNNYSISGSGAGTLRNWLPEVSTDNNRTFHLTWDQGEMVTGGDVTVTVSSSLTDRAGNSPAPLLATHAGGGIGTSPFVEDITADIPPAVTELILPFEVTFSESMKNLTASDFEIVTAGFDKQIFGAAIAAIDTSRNPVIGVMVDRGVGYGDIRLDVRASRTASDDAGNRIAEDYREGPVFSINSFYFASDLPAAAGGRAGESFELSVHVAGGLGEIRYQWYCSDADGKAFLPLTGETGDTLTFSPLTPGDTGLYYCEAGDNVNTLASTTVQLTVLEGLPVSGMGLILLAASVLAAFCAAVPARMKR